MRKIGVFFEFAALTSGFGMLVGGFFGMNLLTGLENVPYLGWLGMLLTIILMALIAWCFMKVFCFLHVEKNLSFTVAS